MAPIADAEALVTAMHDRYADSWYRTLTFRQRNTQTRPDGTVERSVWLEALEMPGRLRIDFVPAEEGNGLLFVADTQYVFQADTLAQKRPRTHPLLLLGFDVYALPPAATLDRLRSLGFDVDVFREDEWQGRPAYVVGAAAGDERSPQFWIDRERLVFVRMIEPTGPNGARTAETRFNRYYELAGGWVAPEVEFLVDGERAFLEEYEQVRANVELDPVLFAPDRWASAPAIPVK